MNSPDENNDLLDSLDKEEIDQLHNATLGFSNQSFELKKFCVTIELSVCALAASLISETNKGVLLFFLKLILIAIPAFFYLVDICTYYYQDKLRSLMFNADNRIRARHKIPLKNSKRFSPERSEIARRIFRAMKAPSNIVYWGLIIASVIFMLIGGNK